MKVIHLTAGPIENNTYIAYDDKKNCVIIDAPFDAYASIDTVLKQSGLNPPKFIFITHTHWDHIGGLAELQRHYPTAKICVHISDAFRLTQSSMNLGGMTVNIEPVKSDIIIDSDMQFQCGDMIFDILHTPGHSPGAVCFACIDAKVVFTGDTLFRESIGRTDFEGSDYNTLINSIKNKLWSLDDDTKVYPGHNETTTIKYEKENNPFLRVE